MTPTHVEPDPQELAQLYSARRKRLAEEMAEASVDGFLTSSAANRRYLTGFTGSAGHALLTKDGATLFTDWRYVEQAQSECPGVKVELLGADRRLWGPLASVLSARGVKRLGFEARHATFAVFSEAKSELTVELVPTQGVVEELRAVKDAHEVDLMRRSLRVAEQAFEHILRFVAPGVTELELATELRHKIELLGAQNQPNLPIIASGPRAALPHGRASEKTVEEGEFVLFDFGAVLGGYYSDMTRTVVCGAASGKQRDIYERVLQSLEAGKALMSAGTTGRSVDRACREPLVEAGYEGKIHGYSVGHGLGLEIHEEPFMSEGYTDALTEGMVITVEPGIYIPGWGGVRIEDTVRVTAGGPEVLNSLGRELIEL